jgi:uncharacterized repeat protein (TIGR03803 family)
LWKGAYAGFAILHDFAGSPTDGATPYAPLIQDSNGAFYGTTYMGGTSNAGTVFELDSTGKDTVLYNFTDGADGGYPYGGLARDSSGDLYGTTSAGGSYGVGTVFKVSGKNVETVLYSFSGGADGAVPYGGVILDSSGVLYGTTEGGGANGEGTVYKVDTTSNLETVLHSFAGADGAFPEHESLMLDQSGNLYGTASEGGANWMGTVFKLDPAGNETTLYSFAGGTADGCYPAGGVTIDGSGNLYGTTNTCGTSGTGVVWKIAPGGESLLYNFTNETDGGYPTAGVILDSSGNAYGVTSSGGTFGFGALFEVSPGGTETVLHSFNAGSDGADPIGGILFNNYGDIYGTAQGSGSNDGTLWGFGLH